MEHRDGKAATRSARVRVGIIGTGFGARVVAGAFRAAECDVIDVVTARDPAAVRALCRSDVDLIAVHSPPFLHASHVAMAVDAGRAVLCDKPFGTSVEDAQAMTDAAESAGVLHFLNFEFRYQPARLALRELVANGAIGRPEHLAYTAYTAGSRVPLRPWGWLFDRSLGGGWIGAFGSHAIDLVRWLFGDISRTGATTWITVPERPDADGESHRCDAEDAFTGWIETTSGATATIDTSFASGANLAPRIVVTGSEGAIENVSDVRLTLHGIDGSKEVVGFDLPPGDPHDAAMHAWARAVREAILQREQILPSFRDGLACMKVMEQWRSEPAVLSGRPTGR